eukprot:34764-Pelagomonas_calceolata.AAC.1
MNDPLIPIPLGVEQVCSQQRGRSDSEVAELRRQGWQQSLAELQDKNNQLRLAWDSEPLMRTAFELLLHTCVTLKKGVAEAVQACRGWLAQGLKLQGPGSNAVLQRTEYVARKLCGARAHREALVVVRSVAEAYVEAGLPQLERWTLDFPPPPYQKSNHRPEFLCWVCVSSFASFECSAGFACQRSLLP